jgi:mRNA-degrading endonuclease RelE of RelBE toxin-antitoxin system
MPYEVRFSKSAFKDVKELPPKLRKKLKSIVVNQVAQKPRSGKKLVGDLAGLYSIRLSFKDRIIYTIDEEHKIVYVIRARTHYGE